MPLTSALLPRSSAAAGRLVALPHAQSTNDELTERVHTAPSEWPHLSVVVTDDQRAGRGRLGRVWVAEAGTSLAVSVLLRPQPAFSPDVYGWIPLAAGAAMTLAVQEALAEASGTGDDADAVAEAAARRVQLKWPNDVLIEGRKVAGVLSELLALPNAPAVVVGVGLNLSMTAEQLPVPTATSLALAGVRDIDVDAVLARFLTELDGMLRALQRANGDAVAAGVHARVAALLGTVGRDIRADLPGGDALEGRATGLAPDGRLLVRRRDAGVGHPTEVAVAAGDITHLRLTGSGETLG
ncbi:biotin--[acetyl-CoA-carboxylase] ligase [Okibacterium fritillariae]|uniref:biotin--[acetyl-CoA-carboxylase] ligase n=1 Tax=Okibacterium fritillariae TaxID=123320 RepID=UPI004055736B